MKKTYTVAISGDKTDGGLIGECDELDAYSQGKTFGEIMENMREAIGLAAEAAGIQQDWRRHAISHRRQ